MPQKCHAFSRHVFKSVRGQRTAVARVDVLFPRYQITTLSRRRTFLNYAAERRGNRWLVKYDVKSNIQRDNESHLMFLLFDESLRTQTTVVLSLTNSMDLVHFTFQC